MFDSLQTRLGGVVDRLRGRGALSEADVDEALREVRDSLIDADVALPVVKEFIDKVRPRAIGRPNERPAKDSRAPAIWQLIPASPQHPSAGRCK